MSQKLTNIETRFIQSLKKGRQISKCGNKFYMSDPLLITKQIKISVNAFEKLKNLEIVRMVGGGRIELVKHENQTSSNW